jgi:LuxR family maltose regulon positive regulatory protein
MLEDLERANLFIAALHEDLQWYRYHAFFSEALRHYARRQLGQECIEVLYSKASTWFEQHGQLEEAIEMALHARAFPRAIALIELQAEVHGFRLDYTLYHWIERLPQDLCSTNPLLCFLSAQHLLFSSLAVLGHRDAYLTLLEKAERLWRGEGNLPRLGSVYALRSLAAHWSGETAHVLDYAGQALEWLSSEDTIWRGIALSTFGAAHRILGNANEAYQALEEGYTLNDRAGYSIASLPTLNAMADILVLQGKLHQASRLRQQVIERSGSFLIDSCEAHIRQSAICFEWNQLDTAESHLQQALAAEKRNEKGQPFAHAHLLLARINMARGEHSQAQEMLQQVMMQASREQLPVTIEELRAYQAWWSLTVGDQDTASYWRQTLDHQAIPTYVNECAYLILSRIMIRQGQPEEALPLLERWLAFSYAQGRSGSALAIAVLRSLALYAMGESQQAQHTITQVLTLAQPEGYMRIFLDEGIALAALLRTTRSRLNEPVLTTYIDTLLAAFEKERPLPVPLAHSTTASPLTEPLSHHERRVLRLLVAGLSNPEIANELIISINTVKTHVKKIYSKLNVSSRKEARDVARSLKLL